MKYSNIAVLIRGGFEFESTSSNFFRYIWDREKEMIKVSQAISWPI